MHANKQIDLLQHRLDERDSVARKAEQEAQQQLPLASGTFFGCVCAAPPPPPPKHPMGAHPEWGCGEDLRSSHEKDHPGPCHVPAFTGQNRGWCRAGANVGGRVLPTGRAPPHSVLRYGRSFGHPQAALLS